MIDQVDRIISSLNALHAEADQVIDAYVAHIRARDNLGGIPLDCIRQTAVENRASSFSMNMRVALELIRDDLGGAKAAPANAAPSAVPEFHLEGVTANLNPKEAARQLKQRRSHE
jgi:hypothetical protein